MPIFLVDGRPHYYAHVPKCAGTSVEGFLRQRFGALAFVDEQYQFDRSDRRPWHRSSPQHVLLADLDKLFPDGFFAQSFAVVRHPIRRAISSYAWSVALGYTPRNVSFEDWYAKGRDLMARGVRAYDNHLAPADAFVPSAARVFKLEDGLDAVAAYLRDLGKEGPDDGSIEMTNQSKDKGPSRQSAMPAALFDRLCRDFAADFDRFDYGRGTADDYALPDASAATLSSVKHRIKWSAAHLAARMSQRGDSRSARFARRALISG